MAVTFGPASWPEEQRQQAARSPRARWLLVSDKDGSRHCAEHIIRGLDRFVVDHIIFRRFFDCYERIGHCDEATRPDSHRSNTNAL